MTKKIKDTDYLAVSARVRAMENSLLTRERMEQVLEARTDEEAVKILQECGYPELDPGQAGGHGRSPFPSAGGNSGRFERRYSGRQISGYFQAEI